MSYFPKTDAKFSEAQFFLRHLEAELGQLELSDWIVRDDRLVIRRLKGSAGGEYHLCASELRALKAWIKVRGTDPGPLFPSRKRTGKGISSQQLWELTRKYGQAARIPLDKCHPHAFKHSCGTHLLNRGEAIEDVLVNNLDGASRLAEAQTDAQQLLDDYNALFN